MAVVNEVSNNTTNKIARVFLPEFEKMRVVSKTVDTGTLMPEFTPQFGDKIRIKRPHQYKSIRTADGDLTGIDPNIIISGSAFAEVQDYITVQIDWTNREETLQLDQLREILQPAVEECVTELETSFQNFLIANSGLSTGTLGTPLTKWGDIANFYALMCSIGVPQSGDHYTVMNPFMTRNLADTQTGLASGDNRLVNTAWENAQISRNFGGMRALMSNSMSTYTSGTSSTRTGIVLTPAPTQTYGSQSQSMIQSFNMEGFSNDSTVQAGDIIEVTGRNRVNIKTRKTAFDQDGNPIPWRYTVVEENTANGSGQFTDILVTNSAIFEATGGANPTGQYDNIDSKIEIGDTVTILGNPSTVYQPSLFYHKSAAGIRSVRLPKLHTWDTVAETSDGISVRVTKYSDGLGNTQSIRFDLLPAFAMFNPLFCGTGWGE